MKHNYRLYFVGLLTSVISMMGCSKSVTEEEAHEFAQPIFSSIQSYRKATNSYPETLMDVENFPYPIRVYKNRNGMYYFSDRDSLSLSAGGVETGLDPSSGFTYHVTVGFDSSRRSNAITSIMAGFKGDGSYEILMTQMPPPLKQ